VPWNRQRGFKCRPTWFESVRNAGLLDELGRLAQIENVNVQQLRKRLSGGFRPFAIRMTDGQEFVIPHPEFLLIGKYSIAVLDKEGFINNLDPLHIVSTKDLSRRNGS
jgi:hypothetical protein